MDRVKEIEKEIREHWFENHKATIHRYDNVTTLDWKVPGSIFYSVRYIFSGHHLYISGDIGDAVFNLTWKSTPESFDNIHIGYLMGKLSCCSRSRWNFNEKLAYKEIEEWYQERILCYEDDNEDGIDEQDPRIDVVNEIKEGLEYAVCESSTTEHFDHYVWNLYQELSQNYFDSEDFSMFADFGKELPRIFYAYLIGIQMANEQLRNCVERID